MHGVNMNAQLHYSSLFIPEDSCFCVQFILNIFKDTNYIIYILSPRAQYVLIADVKIEIKWSAVVANPNRIRLKVW